jgi:glycerol kinase
VILAIDQGTTGTMCLVFDDAGQIAGRAYSEFEQHFPRPGWVEHDANEIWEVTRRAAVQSIVDAGIQGADLAAIGITNQRETVVAWDPDGLVIDPYFSGTKIEWLLRNVEAARGAVFGTIDSWLAFKLTGRHVTDYSNASRTMLFDIRRLRWDPELCDLLGVDPSSLPEAASSAEVYGHSRAFGGEVPVAGMAGDQQAALFGQACRRPGMAKNTYGTGSFVLLNTGDDAPEPGEGLLTTVAWGLGGETDYAL